MAIDYNTGITSIDAGAGEITYSGNEGPKSPDQIASMESGQENTLLEIYYELIEMGMDPKAAEIKAREIYNKMSQAQGRGGIQMASAADPMLQEEYDKYVFEMEEQGLEPMSLEQFRQEAVAGMATGGRVGYAGGQLVKSSGSGKRPGYRGDAAYRSYSASSTGDQRGAATKSELGGGKPSGPSLKDDPTVPQYVKDSRDDEIFKKRRELKKEVLKQEKEQAEEKKDSFLPTPANIAWQVLKDLKDKHNAWARRKYMERYMKENPHPHGFIWDDWEEDYYKTPEGLEELKKTGYLSWMPDVQPSDPDGHYGGVPGAVPHGDIPEWQRLGYPSYEAWLAAQGTGTTGTTGTGSTIPTGSATLPYTVNPLADDLTQGRGGWFYNDGGRVGYAGGGIADLRQGYFLGKVVKSLTKPFKKVSKKLKKLTKSPWAKAALLAGLGYGAHQGWFGKGIGGIPLEGWAGKLKTLAGEKEWLGDLLLNKKGGWSPWKLGIMGASLAPMLGFGQEDEEDEGKMYEDWLKEKAKWDATYKAIPTTSLPSPYTRYLMGAADGGRIGFKRGTRGEGATKEPTWDTDKIKKDLGIALDWSLPGAIGNMAEGITGIAKTNQTEIMNVIKKLVAATPPGQIGEVINFIVDRYKIDPELVQKMVISQMTDANIGFEPPAGTADEGYRPIGIDAGAEDPWDIPEPPRERVVPEERRKWLEWLEDTDWSKVKPIPMPGSEPIPLHPDATTLNPHQDITPWKTMEFRDENQDGIEDRSQGIYKDRDIIPWDPSRKKRYLAYGGRIGYQSGYTVDDEEEEDSHRVAALRHLYGLRRGAQEGGLMDLGGMEKDYRNEGGFVPIGAEERADDVPARLSKNEFVFTADAVRAAGGGDIDKGAEIMENVMENLEQGGNISEESQGLEGARDMFATSQRLEGVL